MTFSNKVIAKVRAYLDSAMVTQLFRENPISDRYEIKKIELLLLLAATAASAWPPPPKNSRCRARGNYLERNAAGVAKAAKEIGGDTVGVFADVSRVEDLGRAFRTIAGKAEHVDKW